MGTSALPVGTSPVRPLENGLGCPGQLTQNYHVIQQAPSPSRRSESRGLRSTSTPVFRAALFTKPNGGSNSSVRGQISGETERVHAGLSRSPKKDTKPWVGLGGFMLRETRQPPGPT